MSLRSCATRAAAAATAALWATLLVSSGAVARPKAPATPTPSPSPTPVADPTVTKLVRQQFVEWQSGSINRALYSDNIQSQLSEAQVNDVSQKLAALGALEATVYIGPFVSADFPADAHGYIYQMQCREGNVYVFTVIDPQGKIATMFFKDRLVTETIEVPATGATATPTP
jgi:hypothetical protein